MIAQVLWPQWQNWRFRKTIGIGYFKALSGPVRTLCKSLFSEVTVQAVTELIKSDSWLSARPEVASSISVRLTG